MNMSVNSLDISDEIEEISEEFVDNIDKSIKNGFVSLRDIIRGQIIYNKEVYDRHSYTRDYRHRKFLEFHKEYLNLYIAELISYREDIDRHFFSDLQYGANYQPMPEELLVLVEEICEHQTVYLNLYYPKLLRELCFEQNIFFLETITLDGFVPDHMKHVNFIIPICYVRRYGFRKRIEVLFCHCSSVDNKIKSFFVDELQFDNIKDKEKHIAELTDYVLTMQERIYDTEGDILHSISHKFQPFEECFRFITRGGS